MYVNFSTGSDADDGGGSPNGEDARHPVGHLRRPLLGTSVSNGVPPCPRALIKMPPPKKKFGGGAVAASSSPVPLDRSSTTSPRLPGGKTGKPGKLWNRIAAKQEARETLKDDEPSKPAAAPAGGGAARQEEQAAAVAAPAAPATAKLPMKKGAAETPAVPARK